MGEEERTKRTYGLTTHGRGKDDDDFPQGEVCHTTYLRLF